MMTATFHRASESAASRAVPPPAPPWPTTPATRSQHGSHVNGEGARRHRHVGPEPSHREPPHRRTAAVASPVTDPLLPPLVAQAAVELDEHPLLLVSRRRAAPAHRQELPADAGLKGGRAPARRRGRSAPPSRSPHRPRRPPAPTSSRLRQPMRPAQGQHPPQLGFRCQIALERAAQHREQLVGHSLVAEVEERLSGGGAPGPVQVVDAAVDRATPSGRWLRAAPSCDVPHPPRARSSRAVAAAIRARSPPCGGTTPSPARPAERRARGCTSRPDPAR